MARRIRIVMSVLCGIACMALMILWVRSYRAADRLHGRFWGRQSFVIAAKQGRVTLVHHRWNGEPEDWRWDVLIAARTFPVGSMRMYESMMGFGVTHRPLMLGPPFTPQGQFGPVKVEYVEGIDVIKLSGKGFTTLNGAGVIVPFWFLILVTAALAASLLVRRRWGYSLRGMLLAFAFAAVLLGMVTILDRAPIQKDEAPGTTEDGMDIIRRFDSELNR
jgi:hypothetical protein